MHNENIIFKNFGFPFLTTNANMLNARMGLSQTRATIKATINGLGRIPEES